MNNLKKQKVGYIYDSVKIFYKIVKHAKGLKENDRNGYYFFIPDNQQLLEIINIFL